MINDREFSSPGEEFSPPAPEFASPGPEQNRGGREFGQPAGAAAPPKKRRRVPGLMFAAAAAVTATVALSAPTPAAVEFPQPENFTAEYRAYLDDIMEACEAEDPLAVHRLGADPMADEFWHECMEPYGELLHERGFSRHVFYDGEEMTAQPGPGRPALDFWHSKSTPEEIIAQNVWEYYTQLTYYQDGSRRHQGVWGANYFCDYGTTPDGTEYAPPFYVFFGEVTLSGSDENSEQLYYHRGTYWRYNTYGYQGDDRNTTRLDLILSGEFSNEPADPNSEYPTIAHYLENGVWTQNFEPERIDYGTGATYLEGGKVETQVVDGSIVLNEYLEPIPSEQPGLYEGLTVHCPDSTGGWASGWGHRPGEYFTLEELLYHPDNIRVY